MTRSGTWRRITIVAGLILSAFAFNTTENLPIGLLKLISSDLDVSLSSVGYLVTGYGLTVAVVSVPLAHMTRRIPRRYVLSGLLAVLCVATWVSVAGSSYGLLLGARVATALCQALFWAVQAPVAVGLFSQEVRGRVVAAMSVGGSLATVLGVPAGTWLGQQHGWRVPFLVLSGFGLFALVAIATLLPTTRPEEGHGAFGSAPDVRRFFIVLSVTALSVTGMFTGFTYIVEFLNDVSGFSDDVVSVMLMVFGLAGVAGVSLTGPFVDRHPRATLALPVALQGVALLGLAWGGGNQAVTIAMLALLGVSAAPVFMASQTRMLTVAPSRTEVALAANSAAFNVGVAAGALLGGVILPALEVRGAFLVGGLLTAASVVVLAGELLLPPPPARRKAPAPADGAGAVGDAVAERH
ncbi:MFS transporter [Streptomyces mashuensis]|uniref:MFS transporter n=1 Tax=Streptomyces mashuensis TaxID=33904 RepID=A0A919B5U2_9ACTN|nr:MFS transporter [Streptomyces mashuensis]GHF52428.1 MFS transporter [Streptomyces mashuensis]